MDSEFDMNLNLEIETESDSSLNSDRWCGYCEERFLEILRRHNECPFCNGRTFNIVDNFSTTQSTDDSDSSGYRNLFLGLTDESDDFSADIYGFNFREEPSDLTTEHGELSDDAAFEELLLRTPPFMTDEPQVEEAESHQYPIRSTRSNIDSYYETPLRNYLWTRRRSSSRSRRES